MSPELLYLLEIAVPLIIAFVIGSIPFGLIVARIFNVRDLTSRGSGNIGATNVSRVVGFWPGILTFVLDGAKGAIPVLLMTPALRELWFQWPDAMGLGQARLGATELSQTVIWAAGFAAVLGHCFSPFLQFKGGKGVATGFGVVLVLSPIAALVGIVGFAFAFATKRVGSLASLTGVLLVAISHLVINPISGYFWPGAAMVLLILFRHEPNIDALLQDRERKFV